METAVEILSRSLRFRLHSPAEWLFQPLLSLWPRGWPPALYRSEGQNGVVTTFGRYTESTNAGFRWHLPYPIQDVALVDVSSVRKAEIGLRGGTQRLKEALMLTDDENIVDVMFNVQYRIKQGNGAEEFLFRTRDPMGAVVQTAESAMREVVGRKKMDSVLFESKQEIAEEVKN